MNYPLFTERERERGEGERGGREGRERGEGERGGREGREREQEHYNK